MNAGGVHERLRNKFKKLGFIDYDSRHPISVHSSLLTVVLHD